jgi:hypothetical protein
MMVKVVVVVRSPGSRLPSSHPQHHPSPNWSRTLPRSAPLHLWAAATPRPESRRTTTTTPLLFPHSALHANLCLPLCTSSSLWCAAVAPSTYLINRIRQLDGIQSGVAASQLQRLETFHRAANCQHQPRGTPHRREETAVAATAWNLHHDGRLPALHALHRLCTFCMVAIEQCSSGY